ncbi:MAG: adenine phosphoribosyltransferase [Deltaproteobacteria bacterium]|nr:adenine phosphoribosyltransferase [Deltaproteobacteria bacterium]MBW2255636.1 adenine phosphoribosyltransferase [Deltaproteobacteria bacterium]
MEELVRDVAEAMRDIPDFPKKGVLFKDITPVLADPRLLQRVIDWYAQPYAPEEIKAVVGMDARGFIFGSPLALALNAAFVPARKKGKLPYETVGAEFDLEYGTATLEIHVDAFQPGDKVLICDDLLATGGTAAATCDLVRRLGGEIVACAFVVELDFLKGREKLDAPVRSLIRY